MIFLVLRYFDISECDRMLLNRLFLLSLCLTICLNYKIIRTIYIERSVDLKAFFSPDFKQNRNFYIDFCKIFKHKSLLEPSLWALSFCVWTEGWTDRQTDRPNEANSRFLQLFCESAVVWFRSKEGVWVGA